MASAACGRFLSRKNVQTSLSCRQSLIAGIPFPAVYVINLTVPLLHHGGGGFAHGQDLLQPVLCRLVFDSGDPFFKRLNHFLYLGWSGVAQCRSANTAAIGVDCAVSSRFDDALFMHGDPQVTHQIHLYRINRLEP